jgi:MFS transporter, PAT family, beta-lactamase induction signal transducer AmpG
MPTMMKSESKSNVVFLLLFLLYFIQSMPYGIQSRYLPLIMRSEGVSLSSLGFYKLLLLPWIVKFALAILLVDKYKTKYHWLILTLILLTFGSFCAAFFTNFAHLAFILFILNWASAVQDICVDWFAMNSLKEEDLGLGNTIQVSAFKLGTLFSGGLLVFLMDYISITTTFTILGSIYLISLIILLKVTMFHQIEVNNKQQQTTTTTFQEGHIFSTIKSLIKSKGTLWISLYVLIYKLGEQSSLNLLPLYLFDHKVSSQVIGLWTGMIGQTASILGSIIAGVLLKKRLNE